MMNPRNPFIDFGLAILIFPCALSDAHYFQKPITLVAEVVKPIC